MRETAEERRIRIIKEHPPQRPIKFRAWSIIGKRMYDWEQMHAYPAHKLSQYFRHHDMYELMQYTGFKDKNGKEAYEGDLYYFSRYSDLPAEIYWDDRWYGWRGRVNGEMQADKTYDISPVKFGEVIGNIYENPELLEKK